MATGCATALILQPSDQTPEPRLREQHMRNLCEDAEDAEDLRTCRQWWPRRRMAGAGAQQFGACRSCD